MTACENLQVKTEKDVQTSKTAHTGIGPAFLENVT
jgi:hypothetical protein